MRAPSLARRGEKAFPGEGVEALRMVERENNGGNVRVLEHDINGVNLDHKGDGNSYVK